MAAGLLVQVREQLGTYKYLIVNLRYATVHTVCSGTDPVFGFVARISSSHFTIVAAGRKS